MYNVICIVFFFQAEDGIRDLVRSRGLGDVYKRQTSNNEVHINPETNERIHYNEPITIEDDVWIGAGAVSYTHLTLPTSDLV